MTKQPSYSLIQKLSAEFAGTLFLLVAIIGSGIMAENLSQGNDGLALMGNCISVGAALYWLITIFGPISGAHFNPAVTLTFTIKKDISLSLSVLYIAVQIAGALTGAELAHVMFELPMIQESLNARTGTGQRIAEGVATFGLITVILAGIRFAPAQVPALVGLYIVSAFWFTASTSFANPAVTIGRMITDTFAGIAPTDVAGFIAAQLIAVPIALLFYKFVFEPKD